jgi:ABC-type dipeptide/oligopeptide/nickel transport system permease subunit
MGQATDGMEFARRKRKPPNTQLIIGALILLTYLAIALLGDLLAPFGADDQDLLAALQPPSAGHPFGTDSIGRDVLSRVIIGTRYTVTVALASVFFASLAGVPMGLVSGYLGGRVDTAITTAVDLLLTIPLLILAIGIASVIGAGMTGIIVATSIAFAPPIARLIRSRVLELREEEYILATRAIGMSDGRTIVRHILPNAATIIIIETTLRAGQAVLVGSALGFLGLGVRPPAPEWGTMLSRGREYMEIAPHLVMAPGLAISLLVLGFNFLGDGLRDLFDPASE